jgi:hypothetical protein
MHYFLFNYSTKTYPFASILERQVFRVPRLSRLHHYLQATRERKMIKRPISHADNLALRSYMQDQPEESLLYQTYFRFVYHFIAPRFMGKISYSHHPKMRVHLPGTKSVSGWHRDADVTGRPEQLTVWLPFTDCDETNTLWLESDYGKRDFQPIKVDYGQVLVFDGGYLEHGTVANDTDRTRVSLDFRFCSTREELPHLAKELFDRRPAHFPHP